MPPVESSARLSRLIWLFFKWPTAYPNNVDIWFSNIAAVCFCFSKRTAIVSAVPTSPIQDEFRWCFLGPILFRPSDVAPALCRCRRAAIVSAVRRRALLGEYACGLLLFQQWALHHLSNQARVQVDESCADNVCSLFRLKFFNSMKK